MGCDEIAAIIMVMTVAAPVVAVSIAIVIDAWRNW